VVAAGAVDGVVGAGAVAGVVGVVGAVAGVAVVAAGAVAGGGVAAGDVGSAGRVVIGPGGISPVAGGETTLTCDRAIWPPAFCPDAPDGLVPA
jgi:hypothetical protein